MKKVKISITSLVIIAMLFLLTSNSNAALQSNGSTPTTQTLNNWIINIRKMESVGGTLGLTETINSNLTSSSGSNNLDIHMEKNTEYGAIAILSASSYGNPNKITSGGTTTGNETGIVIKLNGELVASGDNGNNIKSSMYYIANFKNANAKYKNIYNYSTTYGPTRKGDAIAETSGWHGGDYKWFFSVSGTTWVYPLLRAYSGSIFSYNANHASTAVDTVASKAYYARAIMVCGEGI